MTATASRNQTSTVEELPACSIVDSEGNTGTGQELPQDETMTKQRATASGMSIPDSFTAIGKYTESQKNRHVA
jgi:hypothetical protein